jgi:hypothetical protein
VCSTTSDHKIINRDNIKYVNQILEPGFSAWVYASWCPLAWFSSVTNPGLWCSLHILQSLRLSALLSFPPSFAYTTQLTQALVIDVWTPIDGISSPRPTASHLLKMPRPQGQSKHAPHTSSFIEDLIAQWPSATGRCHGVAPVSWQTSTVS